MEGRRLPPCRHRVPGRAELPPIPDDHNFVQDYADVLPPTHFVPFGDAEAAEAVFALDEPGVAGPAPSPLGPAPSSNSQVKSAWCQHLRTQKL